jgi:hypothetical protein
MRIADNFVNANEQTLVRAIHRLKHALEGNVDVRDGLRSRNVTA